MSSETLDQLVARLMTAKDQCNEKKREEKKLVNDIKRARYAGFPMKNENDVWARIALLKQEIKALVEDIRSMQKERVRMRPRKPKA